MWLQFVWMDFLKHFNWNDNEEKDDINGDDTEGVDIDNNEYDNNNNNNNQRQHELNAHILSQSLSFQNASPFTIIDTISKWTYFQWTSMILFIFLIIYMIFLYCIARRVDAFGDFLKKLQLTQLLKLGKGGKGGNDVDNTNNIDYGTAANDIENDNNNNNNDDDMANQWGLESDDDDDDDDESIFSESDLNEDNVWNYMSSPSPQQNMIGSDGKIDILSIKLLHDIENIYYRREHLILYTVISLVKMLIILLYLSCLVMFFIIPSANYWYLWSVLIDIFTFYVILKACTQIFCRNNNNNISTISTQQRYINDDGDIGILDIDGIFKHEWIVAMVNIVSVTGLLIICTLIISLYMNNYNKFINERINYLQILAAIEIIWFASQFLLWKLNFYGTIFYLLLLIPSILSNKYNEYEQDEKSDDIAMENINIIEQYNDDRNNHKTEPLLTISRNNVSQNESVSNEPELSLQIQSPKKTGFSLNRSEIKDHININDNNTNNQIRNGIMSPNFDQNSNVQHIISPPYIH